MTGEILLNFVFKSSLIGSNLGHIVGGCTSANCYKLGTKNGSKRFVGDMESGDKSTMFWELEWLID
jgi:hypothetical protein